MDAVKTLLVIAIIATPLAARAQAVNFAALDHPNVVSVSTGAEHGLVVGAGYGRVLALADRPILVGGDLTIGFAEADLGDFRARVGATAPIANHGAWMLAGRVATIVRGTDNAIAQMIDVGADTSLVAGRYTRRWFVAAELGFDWALATHITPSKEYRMDVYADVTLRAGRLMSITGDPTMFPIYATLGVDTHW